MNFFSRTGLEAIAGVLKDEGSERRIEGSSLNCVGTLANGDSEPDSRFYEQ
jgi:hypothetical protein